MFASANERTLGRSPTRSGKQAVSPLQLTHCLHQFWKSSPLVLPYLLSLFARTRHLIRGEVSRNHLMFQDFESFSAELHHASRSTETKNVL